MQMHWDYACVFVSPALKKSQKFSSSTATGDPKSQKNRATAEEKERVHPSDQLHFIVCVVPNSALMFSGLTKLLLLDPVDICFKSGRQISSLILWWYLLNQINSKKKYVRIELLNVLLMVRNSTT